MIDYIPVRTEPNNLMWRLVHQHVMADLERMEAAYREGDKALHASAVRSVIEQARKMWGSDAKSSETKTQT